MRIAAKRTRTIIARRQDLIQGTIKSIATLGYHGSTVQTICDAAGPWLNVWLAPSSVVAST